MANYTGVRCPVCNKRFTEADDIVVCPICGAPHHRTCYQQTGQCALNELHIKGHSWAPPVENNFREQSGSASDGAVACPACGAENPSEGIFCRSCGAPMKNPGAAQNGGRQSPFANAYTMAFGGLDPNEELEGVSIRDLALYVGSNAHYFLPRFKQTAKQAGFSINWAAFIFNFAYFFYRKMYAVGGVLLAVFALSQVPTMLIAPEYVSWFMANFEDLSIGIVPVYNPQSYLWAYQIIPYMRFVLMGVSLIFAVFANRLYMVHTVHAIQRIRAGFEAANTFDDKLYTEALARRGRTSRAAVIYVLVGSFVVYFGVCMAIAAAVSV